MKIACLQFAPQVGDVNNNLNRADAILKRVANEELDLLVLPELAFTGYNFKSLEHIRPHLEPSGSGISSLWARTTALKHNCFVVVGYPEKVNGVQTGSRQPEHYNSAIVVSPDGDTVANYRKTHLYDTDERWATESSRGFFRGYIPELGPTAIGICMDLNPYKFQTPWDTFEFAYHIMHAQAKLVIVSMAWQCDYGGREILPQEPDMETLTYWTTRLEPVIRAEEEEEVIVVFCNRTGHEDRVTYAGTSAVIGIKGGEVSVYGLLGRGDRDLLIVDTDQQPYAKLVLNTSTPDSQSEIQDTQSDVAVSSESNYPATSASGRSSRGEAFEDHPESFYTQYSGKSSPRHPSSRSAHEDVLPKKAKPVPPKLHIPKSTEKWSKEPRSAHHDGDISANKTPLASMQNPMPSTSRPRTGLPTSPLEHQRGAPFSAPISKTYASMPDSGIIVTPSARASEAVSPRSRHAKSPRYADHSVEEPVDRQHAKSRGSELSRRGRSVGPRSPSYSSNAAYSSNGSDEIRSTSFTRSRHHSRSKPARDSPPAHKVDESILSSWLEGLPQKTSDSGYYDMAEELAISDVDENRLSTMSRESLVIAASPSVFQTTFPQSLNSILAGDQPVNRTIDVEPSRSPALASANTQPWNQSLNHSAATASPVYSRLTMQDEPSPAWSEPIRLAVPMASAYPSPAYSEPARMGQFSMFDLVEESEVERPPSVILSPAQTPQHSSTPEIVETQRFMAPPLSLQIPDVGKDVNIALTRSAEDPISAIEAPVLSPAQVEEVVKSPSSATRRRPPLSWPKSPSQSRRRPPVPPIPPPVLPSTAHISPSSRTPTKLVIPNQETRAYTGYTPDPSPASFTSSLDTMSPGNEIPPTPLDIVGRAFRAVGKMEGPSTPKAMPVIPDEDEDDEELSTTPLSPQNPGAYPFRSMTWVDPKNPPQTILDRQATW